MKRLTLILATVLMGFVMASCQDSSLKKEDIMKATNAFFEQAEQELQTISSGEEFMDFFRAFTEKKSHFIEELFVDHIDEEGNLKGFSEEQAEDIYNSIYERATAYNRVEAVKAAEFIAPTVDNLEAAVNALYEQYQAGVEFTPENVDAFILSVSPYTVFQDYDNVLPELRERTFAINDKLTEMDAPLGAKINEMYPQE